MRTSFTWIRYIQYELSIRNECYHFILPSMATKTNPFSYNILYIYGSTRIFSKLWECNKMFTPHIEYMFVQFIIRTSPGLLSCGKWLKYKHFMLTANSQQSYLFYSLCLLFNIFENCSRKFVCLLFFFFVFLLVYVLTQRRT